ncbi:MAG: hypothetical protein LBK82_02430 [Planctomycetaceae bacterium]|nr:hypothetical protein [Planctomycetaceae bacterium]
MGDLSLFAKKVAPVGLLLTPKRKATPFAIVHLIHCRPLGDLLLLTKIPLNSYVSSFSATQLKPYFAYLYFAFCDDFLSVLY